MTKNATFKSQKMWIGFGVMLFSVALAFASFAIDKFSEDNFHWFSASGAVMVAGSILFERLQPGSNLSGGTSISSLPSVDDTIRDRDNWLMANGGRISIVVLIFGTLIWAYGPLMV